MDFSLRQAMEKYYRVIQLSDLRTREGKISKIIGMTVEATGLICSIGDICTIHIERDNSEIISEVVGIADNKVYLMPYQEVDGIGYGCPVVSRANKLMIPVSNALIGRTVDPLCRPIDGGGEIPPGEMISINGNPENPMDRPPISEVIELGVKAIDGLMTIGKGQNGHLCRLRRWKKHPHGHDSKECPCRH